MRLWSSGVSAAQTAARQAARRFRLVARRSWLATRRSWRVARRSLTDARKSVRAHGVMGAAERIIDPYQPYDDSRPPPSTLGAFYRHFLYPVRGLIALSIVFGLLIAVADALMLRFAGDIVDMLKNSEPASVNDKLAAAWNGDILALVQGAPEETLWERYGSALLWMAIIVFLARPILIIIDRILMGQGYYPAMTALLRWRTHRHMLRQSVGFFNDDFAGRIANKQIQIAPAFNDTVHQALETLWYAGVFLVTAAVLMADIDWRLLLPLLIWFAMFIATARWFIPRISHVGKEVAEARSRLAGRIVDSYTNIQTVKLFAHADREDSYAKEAMEDMRWTFAEQTRLFTKLEIALTVMNTFLVGGTIGYAVYLWSIGAVSVGAVSAAAFLVMRLQVMTDWVMWMLSMLFQNIGVVMEGMETVSQPHRLRDAPEAQALAVEKAAIQYDAVSHHYGREIKGGVESVSLSIAPGERVGLVGRSGAGKSTLVNLLLRFFDPDKGRILIDGQDIAGVRQESLRAQIGMVTQDTSLLHRSIMDNILYGAPDAGREAAIEAAKRVSAHEFVQELTDREGRAGYDALVGERGVKLSGGQRQRIALARVALKNAPILVLDEATSALDSEVEAAILEAMEELMVGKTVIAIAHRLSTIAQMDRIVVLDQGRVIEDGPHDALLASGGVYAQLWARQSGGFLGVETASEGATTAAPADPRDPTSAAAAKDRIADAPAE